MKGKGAKNWGHYREIDSRVIGVPEDIVIDDNEITGNYVVLVEDVLVHAFDVVYRHRKRRDSSEEARKKKKGHKKFGHGGFSSRPSLHVSSSWLSCLRDLGNFEDDDDDETR